MHKNIIVFSEYTSPQIRPFGESIEELLLSVFSDLGFNASCVHDITGIRDISSSIVLFVMPPERFLNIHQSVSKNNNTFVFWNLEPFNIHDDIDNKFARRREVLYHLVHDDGYLLDYVWCYNKTQCKYLNSNRCFYLPVGYHSCMEPAVVGKKTKQRQYIFLGHPTTIRRNLFTSMRRKGDAKGIQNIRPKVYSYKQFVDLKQIKSAIAHFRIGIDIHATLEDKESVRWHRLMMYAASEVTILSNSKLERYGFKSGEHYLYCRDAADYVTSADRLLTSWDFIARLANNMKNKVAKDYNMTNLVRNVLSQMNF